MNEIPAVFAHLLFWPAYSDMYHYRRTYIDREIYEQLKTYADEKGQTMTTAIERILKQFFDKIDDGKRRSDG